MEYDPKTLDIQEIRPERQYQGLRITFRSYLGTARVPMQIDVGAGDVVEPGPKQVQYPRLLERGVSTVAIGELKGIGDHANYGTNGFINGHTASLPATSSTRPRKPGWT